LSSSKLRRDVFNISVANAINYALQFILPIVVARTLTPEDFAGYRMVWLVVGTLMAFATLDIPTNLSYFLPRLQNKDRARYIVGAVCILIVLAAISSALINPWYPLLPVEWVEVSGPAWFYSVFVFLWVIASLLDWLPISDGRARWQAGAIITLAISRLFLVSLVAWITGSLEAVLYALILFTLLKLGLLGYYILRFHHWEWVFPKKQVLDQISYSWSFGFAGGFYVMRQQIESWMVAALFSAREFASFSLGGVAAPLFGLIRESVNNVVFPNLSELEANKDKKGIADLNRKATSVTAFVLFPIAIFLWFFADEVISIVYTSEYIDAANVLRVYLFGVIPQVFESGTLLRLTAQGRVALMIDLMMIPFVISISYLGIQYAGLPGGATGSIAALFFGSFLAIRKGVFKLKIKAADLYDVWYLGWVLVIGVLSGGAAVLGINTFEISSDIGKIIIGGAVMVFSYLLSMYLLKKIPTPLMELYRDKICF
jgi:O-antigen/teichoic acid export membrane protein